MKVKETLKKTSKLDIDILLKEDKLPYGYPAEYAKVMFNAKRAREGHPYI